MSFWISRGDLVYLAFMNSLNRSVLLYSADDIINECTALKIIDDLLWVYFNCVSLTLANVSPQKQSQPIISGKIDCLCKIKSPIESLMISATKSDNKFIRIVDYFGYSDRWIDLLQIIWIDGNHFMSHVFRTFLETLSKVLFSHFLQFVFIFSRNAIPQSSRL